MNARTQTFDLVMEDRQMCEALSCICHTVLFHRSTGKFTYTSEDSYSVGSVGYTDVDCDFIDLTYVCCTSPSLDKILKTEISNFAEQMRSSEAPSTGTFTLAFHQKKNPPKWFISTDSSVTWEEWKVQLELINMTSEYDRQASRERLGDVLADKVFDIAEAMNRDQYIPKMPNQSELSLIFDSSHEDVQPYLFKCTYHTATPSHTVGSAVKKLFNII